MHRSWETMAQRDPFWAVLSSPDKRGGRWDLDEFLETGRETVDGVVAQIRALGLDPWAAGDSALDFGTGVGRLAQALARHFGVVHGVDISEAMLAEAERINRFPGTVRFHLNQAPDLATFPDGSIGLVLSHLVLQHMSVKAARRYLQEFARVLAPGGVLVVQIPVGQIRRGVGLRPESLPPALRTLLLRARMALTGRPGMEMHVIARADVEATLSDAAMRVLFYEDRVSGAWRNAQYVAERLTDPPS